MQKDNPSDDQETPSTEQESSIEQSENASPEELGVGQRQSNEPFSPIDFDSIIEKAAADITNPSDDQQPASEVVADGQKKEEAAPAEEIKDEKPADGGEKPADGAEKPADGAEKPADGAEKTVENKQVEQLPVDPELDASV